MPVTFSDFLSKEFERYAHLSATQLEQLSRHYELLVAWNRRLNLTRILSLEEAVTLHYCESLFLANWLPAGPLKIVDVGSGAGFPGIPIAVLRPECEVVLSEAHQRKAVFLREATRGFSNVSVISGRAETLRIRADWVVSRAVVPDAVLSLKLAPDVALLISSAELGDLPPATEVAQVPWGSSRVIAKFHMVPRETALQPECHVKRVKIDKRGQGHRDNEPKGRCRENDDRD